MSCPGGAYYWAPQIPSHESHTERRFQDDFAILGNGFAGGTELFLGTRVSHLTSCGRLSDGLRSAPTFIADGPMSGEIHIERLRRGLSRRTQRGVH
jgi:hypothetical protein